MNQVGLTVKIALNSEQELYYQHKGDFNFEKSNIDQAIEDYNKAIKINPENIYARIKLAQIYIKKIFYEKAFDVIEIAIRIDYKNPNAHIAQFFLLSSMRNFGLKNIIKLNESETEDALTEIENEIFKSMKKSLNKAIYFIYNSEENFALNEDKSSLDIVQYFYYNICGYIYYIKKDYDRTLKILSRLKSEFENDNFAIARKHNFIFPSDSLAQKQELLICDSLDTAFYIGMIKLPNCLNVFFLKVLEILLDLKYFDFYSLIFMKKAELYDAFYNGIEEDFNKIKLEIQAHSKKEILGDYQSWQKELNKKWKELFFLNKKLDLLEDISKSFIEETRSLPENERTADKFRQQSNFMLLYFQIHQVLQEKHEELIEKKEQEKAQARIEERNKVIADLSHSIKNLISTVIDPLENMKNDTIVKQPIIDSAIRGANLVREIVNAMNLSYKGSIEDFRYDAKNNDGYDKQNIKIMILESLKNAVGNMYDGKYFSAFQEGYFQTEQSFIDAKLSWNADISQSKNLEEVSNFTRAYFFEPFIDIKHTEDLIVGNEKGSAVKLLILFSELILNAVKYSAFVKRDKRFVKIEVLHNSKQVSVLIENRFNPKKRVKTAGLGNVVITNFAKLLNTSPLINRENDIYSVQITFENFWDRS